MPELPEVETVARQIRRGYLNRTIRKVDAKPSIIFQNVPAPEFAQRLAGKRLRTVNRYGKFLYWELEDAVPVFHLGMSGIFLKDASRSLYPQHIHLRFQFEDGVNLYFQDVRKFGKIYLYDRPPAFDNLGPDPTDENFTLNTFRKLLNLKTMNVKTFLMDQKQIAGIGNIYANEALFDSRIHPLRPVNEIRAGEAEHLFRSIRKILAAAIENFGTSYTAYRTVEGETGENQNFLKVYQRFGQPCPRCGTAIEKIVLNSRSTFFCPVCQV